MLKCTILENGALRLTADNATRRQIAEDLAADMGWWATWAHLFERYETNGQFTPFDAGDGNPCIGLTSAPAIAESMDIHDDGSREIVGRAWYNASYEMRDELDELKRLGRYTYNAVPMESD